MFGKVVTELEKENLDVNIESLKPQFERKTDVQEGCNLWGSDAEPKIKPLSNQDRLRDEFGDRSE